MSHTAPNRMFEMLDETNENLTETTRKRIR